MPWGAGYAKRLVFGEGYGTAQGLAEVDAEGLVGAGMRKCNAKPRMGRVSQKCTPSGGGEPSKNGEGSDGALANAPRGLGGATDSVLVSMVEAYAIAASKTAAVAAVNARD